MRPADDDAELLLALDWDLAKRHHREIAQALFGAERVAEDWDVDGSLRSVVRRRIEKATFLMELGYRDLAAGRKVRPRTDWAAKRRRRARGLLRSR